MLSDNPATSEKRQSASWKLVRRSTSVQARGGSEGHADSSASGGEGVDRGGDVNKAEAAVEFGRGFAVKIDERALTCCSIWNVSVASLATDLDLSYCS